MEALSCASVRFRRFPEQAQNLLRVALRIDAAEYVAYAALLVDDEGRAVDHDLRDSVQGALFEDAEKAADVPFGIRQQAHREPMLVAKRGMREHIIAGNPEHDRINLFELIFEVGKVDGLTQATGRTVLQIKIQHHVAAPEVVIQTYHLHASVWQGETRHLVANTQHV